MLGKFPAYANIPVVDLERAKKFYTETLGLTEEGEHMPGVLLLKAGQDTKVMLYQRAPSKADHTLMSFTVDDLEASVDELTAAGVKFEQYDFGKDYKTNEKGIMVMGPTASAWFKDSEGNVIALYPKM